jgi:hypothetical protein
VELRGNALDHPDNSCDEEETILGHVVIISVDDVGWNESHNQGRAKDVLQPDQGNPIELNFGIERPLASASAKIFANVVQRQRPPDPVVHDGRLEIERGANIKRGFSANS